jgi:hypothetical protein
MQCNAGFDVKRGSATGIDTGMQIDAFVLSLSVHLRLTPPKPSTTYSHNSQAHIQTPELPHRLAMIDRHLEANTYLAI